MIEHNECELCKSKSLEDIFSLGNQFVNDFVPKERIYSGVKAPLDLIICKKCSLIQLKHTAPQELLYTRHYWYRSGVTNTVQKWQKMLLMLLKRQ